jgi:hypothetical protein
MILLILSHTIHSRDSLIIFISHTWLRGGSDCIGWDGIFHPDNANNDKLQLCIDGIERLWQSLAPSMQFCYVWFDYSCIDQTLADPTMELERLDQVMSICDCMFTPIVDSNYMKWNLHLFGNLFVDYQAESFRHGNLAYLNRAWCRLEMLYAANIPLQIESKAYVGNRYLKFLGGLKFAAEQNRRPHILYGSKEYYTSKQLLMLPPLAKSYFHEYNPEMGFFTFPARYATNTTFYETITTLLSSLL